MRIKIITLAAIILSLLVITTTVADNRYSADLDPASVRPTESVAYWIVDYTFEKHVLNVNSTVKRSPVYEKELVRPLNKPDPGIVTRVEILEVAIGGWIANHGPADLYVHLFAGNEKAEPYQYHIMTVAIEPGSYVNITDALTKKGHGLLLAATAENYESGGVAARMIFTSGEPIEAHISDIVIQTMCKVD